MVSVNLSTLSGEPPVVYNRRMFVLPTKRGKKMKRLLLAVILALVCAPAGHCQQFVRLLGGDNSPPNNTPLSTTNPLPISVVGGSGGLTGVKGADGATIASPTNPLPTTTGSVAAASVTNVTAAIAAVDTTVTLAAPSRHITVKTSAAAGTNIIYLDFTGAVATTADFQLDPGGAISIDLGVAISSYHYIGAGAVGTISTLAY